MEAALHLVLERSSGGLTRGAILDLRHDACLGIAGARRMAWAV